ncbi:D-alanine--D-alanine ligase B [bacterium BMS3Abin03]|nr:D-alanine--D-alanine ligase B [bacterium BMS3Abin03]
MNKYDFKIAIFIGGTSPERDVSKSSGKAIYEAVNSLGYETVLIDPAYGTNQPEDDSLFFDEKDFAGISNGNYLKAVNSDLMKNVDLVFIALHGKWGEDGTIQSILELKGIRYTGSGVMSSAVAMDKLMSKILFRKSNVNTADWLLAKNNFVLDEVVEKIKSRFGFPCVIKPNDQGSTVGLTIAKSESDVEASIKLALQFSNLALIEEYIEGREMTVAILDGEALPVLEIIPKDGFYDYKHKYTHGMSEYIVPAEISGDVFKEMQKQAEKAFESLRCSTYARVDFRLNEKNIPYCLEVNTLPGMTSTSLVPKMAQAVGISFEELIDRIIRNSLDGKK